MKGKSKLNDFAKNRRLGCFISMSTAVFCVLVVGARKKNYIFFVL
jgi:hypothetical protein